MESFINVLKEDTTLKIGKCLAFFNFLIKIMIAI